MTTRMIILFFVFFGGVSSQATPAAKPFCRMASEGIYNGLWVKHRIMIQENIAFGANDLDSILSQLEVLREEGICR